LVHHSHIINAVPDCQGDLFRLVLLDQFNDVSLLRWGHPAANKHFRCQSQLHEAISQPCALSNLEERVSRENSGVLGVRQVLFESFDPLLFLSLDVLQNHRQIVHDVLLALLFNPENLSSLIENFAREANINSSLNFITSKHPELNSSLFDCLNRVSCLILNLVFDSSGSKKAKVSFDL